MFIFYQLLTIQKVMWPSVNCSTIVKTDFFWPLLKSEEAELTIKAKENIRCSCMLFQSSNKFLWHPETILGGLCYK